MNDDNDSSPAPTTSGSSVLDAARQRSNLSVFYRAAANAGLNGGSSWFTSALLLLHCQSKSVYFKELQRLTTSLIC